MRWPWVGRFAYDDARSDVLRLTALVESLAERYARLVSAVERKAVGLPEREPAPRQPTVEWDMDLEAAAQCWGTSYATQKALAMEELRKGKSKVEVLQLLSADGGA